MAATTKLWRFLRPAGLRGELWLAFSSWYLADDTSTCLGAGLTVSELLQPPIPSRCTAIFAVYTPHYCDIHRIYTSLLRYSPYTVYTSLLRYSPYIHFTIAISLSKLRLGSYKIFNATDCFTLLTAMQAFVMNIAIHYLCTMLNC
jgi:hypothetical protein